MKEHITDIVALAGLVSLSGGVYLMFGPGPALVAGGSGLYLTAILTEVANAVIQNQRQSSE